MSRPITLYSGHWTDLQLEDLCSNISTYGFDGIEIACTKNHLDVRKAAEEPDYLSRIITTLNTYNLGCYALNSYLCGQCVGDLWDPRINAIAPDKLSGSPEAIRNWAIEEIALTAQVAAAMGCKVVTGYFGSPIWRFLYPFPPTTKKMIQDGFLHIKQLWTPILDVFDDVGVKFALDIHPTGIAYDYYTTKKLFEVFDYRSTLGINFNPANLVWQGIQPELFIQDFAHKIYHVHIKDAAVTLDGKASILGSHLEMGDARRGWNYRSPGRGDVNFENIFRALNNTDYEGPLSINWEDADMDREYGIQEAFEYTRTLNYPTARSTGANRKDIPAAGTSNNESSRESVSVQEPGNPETAGQVSDAMGESSAGKSDAGASPTGNKKPVKGKAQPKSN